MADNASTTNTPSDAQARSKPPTNLSISFSPFNGGDVKISAIFQGHKVAGKVAAQAMVLASPVSILVRFLFYVSEPGSFSYLPRARAFVNSRTNL